MKKLDNGLAKLAAVKEIFMNEIDVFETTLKSYIKFEFNITDLGGDGLSILHSDSSNVCPLDSAVYVIKTKGKLTFEDFDSMTM